MSKQSWCHLQRIKQRHHAGTKHDECKGQVLRSVVMVN